MINFYQNISSEADSLFEYLSKIVNNNDYRLIYSANPVLNKVISSENIPKDTNINKTFFIKALFKSLVRFTKFYIYLFIWMIVKLIYLITAKFSFQDFKISAYDCIIDTWVLEKSFINNKFIDLYFGDLKTCLEKRGLCVCYVGRLAQTKGLMSFFRKLFLLARRHDDVILPSNILSTLDYIKVLFLSLQYPFIIISKAYKVLQCGGDKSKYVVQNLLNSILSNPMDALERFYFAKKIGKSFKANVKLYSWHENQGLEKLFYKGIRASTDTCKIYGAQLALLPQEWMSHLVDESEDANGLNPDVILVNGSYFMRDNKRYRVAPSLSSQYICQKEVKKCSAETLFVLPYYDHSISRLLKFIGLLKDEHFRIKFHPATNSDNFIHQIPANAEVTNKSIADLCSSIQLVVGASTGLLIEAVVMGIPAVVIKTEGQNYTYLPEYGRGIVWDSVETIDSYFSIKKSLLAKREEQEWRHISDTYLKMFFTEMNEDSFQAFLV